MSDWVPKEQYPDLSSAKRISFDLETKDPNIKTMGPGTFRKDGHIIGFSIATNDGFCGYYPVKHNGGNVSNPDSAIKWFKDQLNNDIPKVGANLLYDLEWARGEYGLKVPGIKYDCQVSDPLIDENYPNYTLDSITERWLPGKHKDMGLLVKAGIEILGHKLTDKVDEKAIANKVRGELYKLHSKWVGGYAESDAALPLEIFAKQEVVLKDQGLWDVFLLECQVQDLLVDMRFLGVPIDEEKAVKYRDQLRKEYEVAVHGIKRRTGIAPNVWANEDVVKICEKLKLPFQRTALGNPSFPADWLRTHPHPALQLLAEARKLDRSGAVFIQSKILDLAVNGRLYPQFWQVKSEKYGTTSGRLSSSNPNAQQFPARDERIAPMVRSLLIAEQGCEWGAFDWKSQEPRLAVHYAALLKLPGAQAMAEEFIKNPDLDIHQMVSNWTGLSRKIAKTIGLGKMYGMGAKKYSTMYNTPLDETYNFFRQFDEGLPYIKPLSNRCENMAKHRGWIKTLLGRQKHFNLYGPRKFAPPLRKEEALKEYGAPVQQYFTYKALNSLIQGSAADMVKKAMVDCHKAGYIPNLTVHDELDFADISSDKMANEIKEIMLNCVQLKVPLAVDVKRGPSWGECK